MAVIIQKPILPDNADQEQQAAYNTALAQYKSYLQDIRLNAWNYLAETDLPDNQIDTFSRLQAAEERILTLFGQPTLDRAGFNALSMADQNRLLRGVIFQTALAILPTVPQIKRAEFSNLENEYFQVTLSDREKALEDNINKLFPSATVAGNIVTTGGAVVDYPVAF